MKRSLAIFSAVLVLSVLSGCTKKSATGDVPKKVTIGIQVGVCPNAIAVAEGWLTEALGTEVDIVHFDAGRDVVTAMASGSIDIGQVGSPPASLAIANGVPCQVFYIQSVIGESQGLVVRNNLGIKDAKGLIGRRIATTFSSTSHYGLMKYLELNNINPKDIDIIDMRSGEMVAAYLRGNIDGAWTWDPNTTQMKNNGGVMITNAREMADRGYAVVEVDIVRTEFAHKYPDLMNAYVRTMDRAVALHRSDPKAAATAMARHTGLTVEECLARAEGSVWLLASEQRSMRWAGSSVLASALYTTAKFLYENGDILQEPSLDIFQQAVTNRYLDPYVPPAVK